MKSEDLDVEIQVIPEGSFIVFITERPQELIRCFDGPLMDMWKAKKFEGGVILNPEIKIQTLSDQDLAEVGLQRIPKPKD